MALMMVAAFAATTWWLPQIPAGEDLRKTFTIPELADPGRKARYVTSKGNDLSMALLLYGLGPSIESARKADILIIGNSRAQLGTDEAFITSEAARYGLNVFNLAVGHGDGVDFAREVMKRHDLRPKVVIVNGGPFIFNGGYSNWTQEVIDMGRWEARKMVWERRAAWGFQAVAHRYIPRIEYFGGRLTSGWVQYRSVETGWWRSVLVPPHRYQVTPQDPQPQKHERALPLARKFKGELSDRGAVLVLTTVPYFKVLTDSLVWLADQIDVPVVIPSFEGIETADGSHLTVDSKQRITRELWPRVMDLPQVRRRLDLPPRVITTVN